ncbi:hypothetical protein [Erythrobacter crassostreae]|uniref:Uncharacterized protein n=1 Tax=Erythrobacter crassostreae TaxID=2828328 RepID=A0A9X1JQA8_9SPHN|nr:hypothetical protein [Erythrobacter crassostrea]MBV7260212.1 hypothetical protein [Erythrobacter crassostrea]
MPEKRDNKAIGITFVLAGLGVILSLGLTVGWVFAPAGAALAIVGLVYLTQNGESE